MSRWGQVLAGGILAVGLVLIVSGSFADGYAQGVLLEVGAALVLASPLVLFERYLESKIEDAREASRAVAAEVAEVKREVARTSDRLDELAASTSERLQALADSDERVFRAVEDSVSASSIRDLLDLGIRLNAVSAFGVRVQVPLMWDRLRFEPSAISPDGVTVHIEGVDGGAQHELEWADDQPASDLLQQIAEFLQSIDHYPGNDPFNGTEMFARLLNTVRTPVDMKRRGSSISLAPVVEILNEQWAVTVWGLECLEHTYPISAVQLTESDTKPHVMAKTWVSDDDFYDAFLVAERLHGNGAPDWIVAQRSEYS
jgi:hypothetical protein